jgi:hypothetical protein
MKDFLKVLIIAATNLFVMAVIAFAMPAGDLSAQNAAPSLDGVWRTNNGHTVTINGAAAVSTQLSSGALWRDAINKGYVKVGDQIFRNIIKGSTNMQWSCQELSVEFRSSAPTVATGLRWENRTITMNANGQSIRVGNTTYRSNPQTAVTAAVPSINGVWEVVWGHTIKIDGSSGVYVEISVQPRWQDALLKGYIKVGGQKYRNLTRTGDLTYTGQDLDLLYDTSAPDAATGVIWRDCTVYITRDGNTLIITTPGKDNPNVTYTRNLEEIIENYNQRR